MVSVLGIVIMVWGADASCLSAWTLWEAFRTQLLVSLLLVSRMGLHSWLYDPTSVFPIE